MLRPRGCVWGPESGPPFKNKIGVRACVCACFPDAITTRSPGGSWSSLEPAGCLPAPCAPRARPGKPGSLGEAPPVAAKGNLMGRRHQSGGSPGPAGSRASRASGHSGGRTPGEAWAAASPEGPARVLLPAGRPGLGLAPGLCHCTCPCARGTRPGRAPRPGGPWSRSRPSAQRLRVPASAPGPAWRAGPDPPRGGAGEGRE